MLCFRDWLLPTQRLLPARDFADLPRAERELALLRRGFLHASLPPAFGPVGSAPVDADDALFWQFPCRTEAAAQALHAALDEAPFDGGAVNVYLGLPWATWIDRRRVDPEHRRATQELAMQRVRIAGFRQALQQLGVGLRVHTVCQHVYWRQMLADWRGLGLTDVWLSHAPDETLKAPAGDLKLHPWRLYAVNVEDAARAAGLRAGVDPAAKPLLASFVGTHADHYLSDSRLRLQVLAGQPRFEIRLTEKWHFEDVVYRHQVQHEPLAGSYRVDASVADYNRVLSDSVFSLCPAGAGPNSLRLWESLAVGAVPVLLGPAPRLPQGGSLPPIDWEQIVLRVADAQIPDLPRMLGSFPMDEVRRRQRLGMAAFAAVQAQRCF
jgi:hypothetical protein